jgi:hypothetical protein
MQCTSSYIFLQPTRPCSLSRYMFKRFHLSPVDSQYLLAVATCLITILEVFQENSYIQAVNIRHKHDLHRQVVNLTVCQKGICCAGIKLYDNLPQNIVTCMSDSLWGFGLEIGFIDHFNTHLVTTLNYGTIADLRTLQITRAHRLVSLSLLQSPLGICW